MMDDDWQAEERNHALTLAWFSTAGGPFILLPGENLMYWRGIDPSMDESAPASKFRWGWGPDEPASDYDRACDAVENSYAGMLSVGPGQGLVFDDANSMTVWWAPAIKEEYDEGMFVNWDYADTEDFVIQSLAEIPDDIWQKQDLTFVAGAEPVYLIDSGMPGDELGREDYRAIKLKPGPYSIYIADYKPDEQTSLLLIRLTHSA